MPLLSALLFAGCSGGFNAPIPDETRLSDLTGSQLCELQQALQSWRGGALLEDPCTVAAQSTAAAAASQGNDYTAACELSRDTCIEASRECVEVPFREDCSATIEEYELCVEDMSAIFADATSDGCAPPDPSEPRPTLTPPASCQIIEACLVQD